MNIFSTSNIWYIVAGLAIMYILLFIQHKLQQRKQEKLNRTYFVVFVDKELQAYIPFSELDDYIESIPFNGWRRVITDVKNRVSYVITIEEEFRQSLADVALIHSGQLHKKSNENEQE